MELSATGVWAEAAEDIRFVDDHNGYLVVCKCHN